MSKPSQRSDSDYLAVLESVREYEARPIEWPAIRWVILSNTTQEPMVPFLKRSCFDVGYRADIRLGGFDTALQDAADPASPLFDGPVDLVVLALGLRGLAPVLLERFASLSADAVEAETARVLDYVGGVVAQVRLRSQALVLVHSFETPVYPELGVMDYADAAGQINSVRRLNLALTAQLSRAGGVFIVDLDALRMRAGSSRFADPRTWHVGRVAYSREGISAIAAEYMKFARALKGQNKKCLVVDADGTLWGGIAGEDGVDGVQVGRSFPGSPFYDFQQALVALRDRGVLLALCSKNDPEAVDEVFTARADDMPLRLQHFAATRVNWADKAQNIREIAAELNIGLDSLVFADDSPFEVNLVRELLPAVHTIQLPADPARYCESLAECGLFDSLTLSAEDRTRGEMYRAERRRIELATSGSSVDDYLRELAMEVDIALVGDTTVARVAQLTQKTNQFNLTTRRYNETDICGFAASPAHDVYGVRLRDRLGDSGLIGVAILRHDGPESVIDTLLLSCRVLGRGVEDALLTACTKRSATRGSVEIIGEYRPTAKNAQVAAFYQSRGFLETEPGIFRRSLSGAQAEPFPRHIGVTVDGQRVP